MSAKKSPKKGKGSKDSKAKDAPDDISTIKLKRAESEIASLQRQLVEREHEVSMARNEEKLLRERLIALTRALDEQHEAIEDVTDDLTRRFKAGQDQLLTLVADLSERNKELQQTLDRKEDTVRQMNAEKDRVLHDKDRQIQDLKGKMEEMSVQFAAMLKETLEKMSDRVTGQSRV
ncbi:hypothetical protein KFL_000430190 [Klebsormidium nitens]|uniref:Dynein regulatory complex protein 12 n=1 Tax=Klebsormidium nitens TaxID=105231 RepID=A0A1Y1HTW3_KLENI|nr:hypothetical protein KFL_000430190 [Klebsormidium nitens]|eukprot:GAQ79977.1 hypothetical protein KFL_000430190 [Klebsormidium nitens]